MHEAIIFFRSILRDYPKDLDSLVLLGILYRDIGKTDEAK